MVGQMGKHVEVQKRRSTFDGVRNTENSVEEFEIVGSRFKLDEILVKLFDQLKRLD
jgi:hypothetical protein